jgi:HAD superfamily hydrolase (TIGR01484 family)
MLPLSDWPVEERRAIAGVMADIDDTLTTEGQITDDALAALHRLRAAGVHSILVTGRPAGWSEPFALSWPVDAIVAENGAVALFNVAGRVEKIFQQDGATRSVNLARMQAVAARILREVPGASLAQDSAGRETDIAVDHSEFTRLAPERIGQVLGIMREEGMNASVSSIHINGWYGEHDKLAGARWILRHRFGRELDAEIGRWVYVGDSTNDQVMFRHFPHSAGVANIRRFEAELQYRPRYVCAAERGAGFAELADAVLAARGPA